MSLQQLTKNETNISLLNQVFAKIFYTKLSKSFQKFKNNVQLGKIKIENAKFQELYGLLKLCNTKKITLSSFVDRIAWWVENCYKNC